MERYYETIMEQMREAVIIAASAGRLVYMNREALKWTGKNCFDAAGTTLHDILPEKEVAWMLLRIEQALTTGEQNVATLERETASRKTWYQISFTPLQMREGTIDTVLIMMTDSTKQKQLEAVLQTSHDDLEKAAVEWETTFDSIQDCISIQCLDGMVIRCNAAYERFIGKKNEEIIGKYCYQLVHGLTTHITHCPHCSTIQKRSACNLLFEVPEQNTVFEITTTPFFDEAGEIKGTVHVMRDVTSRFMARKQLEEQNRELEKAIERANEMAVKAELASIAKAQFLATMSHEIRTPLNGVIGMCDLLRDTSMDTEQQKLVEIIRCSGDALLNVVDDILDYSKIEAGKLKIDEKEFDLHLLADETMKILAARALAKKLEFTLCISKDVYHYYKGDPVRLRQMLLNIGGNAIKFTDKGFVTIKIELAGADRTGSMIRFSITDSGIGIVSKDVARLFTPFTQLDNTYIRKHGGTGLGLAITKQLVDLMHGTISVKSVRNRGTTFTIVVPLRESEKNSEIAQHMGVKSGCIAIMHGFGKNERNVLFHYMRSWGVRPIECTTIDEVVELLTIANLPEKPVAGLFISDRSQVPLWNRRLTEIKDTIHYTVALVTILSVTERPESSKPAVGKNVSVLDRPLRRSQLYEWVQRHMAIAPTPGEITAFADSISQGRKHHLNVLVAEDNEINAMVIEKLLTSAGCTVELVNDGKEAIEKLTRFRYDAVFMDLRMPEMDGITAANILRDPKSGVIDHGIPIIVSSASVQQEDEQRCLSAGVNFFLRKPVRRENLDELLNVIGKGEFDKVQPQHQTDKLLEIDYLMETLDNDISVLHHVLDMYVEDGKRLLLSLGSALQEDTWDRIRHYAHTLRGASLTIGANEMVCLTTQMEKVDENSPKEHLQELLAALETAFGHVVQAIAFIKTGGLDAA